MMSYLPRQYREEPQEERGVLGVPRNTDRHYHSNFCERLLLIIARNCRLFTKRGGLVIKLTVTLMPSIDNLRN